MQIDQILAARQYTVNSKTVNSKQSVYSKLLTDKEIQTVIEQVSDLINPEYRAWHIKRMLQLKPDEYLARADRARKFGKDKRAYFTSLLKLK